MSTPLNTHESWTSWTESGHWAESSDTAMPMLPAIAGDVMGLAMDPEVSIARIARVIAKDQVLATRVLRLANSAYCASMQAITTVHDAIVRMGTGPVRNAVLAVCFTSHLHGANVYGTQGRDLMDHAIGTTYLARLLAERLGTDHLRRQSPEPSLRVRVPDGRRQPARGRDRRPRRADRIDAGRPGSTGTRALSSSTADRRVGTPGPEGPAYSVTERLLAV